MITAQEPFDRGLYAGPVGWMNGTSSEFVVAIRSALVQPVARPEPAQAAQAVTKEAAVTGPVREDKWGRLLLYAGVGLVPGASPHAEWHELNLKIKPFRALVSPPVPLAHEANVNALAARLMVEELTRVCYPASPSSPTRCRLLLRACSWRRRRNRMQCAGGFPHACTCTSIGDQL